MNIRLFKPAIGKEELDNIKDVFEKAWLGLGPRVKEFETKWSRFIGVYNSVAVNSCTAALHLAVHAFKFQQGHKIMVPAITFASTAMAPIYNGLTPVFVDVDEKTGGISLDDLEKKYTKDCVAVIPVHYCGHPVPMDRLVSWAGERQLKVIEDCAHTAGGEYQGRKLGTWGDIGCFSFEEKKCLTTGDGGMICSNDGDLLKPLKASRWVGINKDTWERLEKSTSDYSGKAANWYYEIQDIGYKYNMNDLAASIGLAQLAKIKNLNKKRSEIIRKYMEGIKGLGKIRAGIPYQPDKASYQMFIIRTAERNKFIAHMNNKNIATGVHYMPLHRHPYFRRFKAETPVADKIWQEFVTLPLHADLTDNEVNYVIEQVRAYDQGI